jgi:hypothetical protein
VTASAHGTTRVEYSFTLPPTLTLQRHPWVQVTDSTGQRVGLLPMSILQRAPNWAGFRDMNTRSLKRGVYQVVVGINYTRADGTTGTASTLPKPLTVP